MPTLKNVRCSIFTKNGLLKEYSDDSQVEDSSTSTVYIVAEDSEPFWIECEVLLGCDMPSGSRMAFNVEIDGIYARSKLNGRIDAARINSESVREFSFGKLLLVEDHESDVRVDSKKLSGLGEILVSANRCYLGKRSSPAREREIATLNTVNEKSMKGRSLTHSIKLGAARPSRSSAMKTTHIDSPNKPYVKFRFLYRSKTVLQNMALIPRTPSLSPIRSSPQAPDGEVPLENMTHEQMVKELEVLRAKARQSDAQNDRKRKIKEEDIEGGTAPRKSRNKPPLTIDLTGDD